MAQLSAQCRKWVTPEMPCSKQASQKAMGICAPQKDVGGGAYGRCMNANYEHWLVEYCGPVVCPNDPQMVADSGLTTMLPSNSYASGGEYTGDQTDLQSGGGGMDITKMDSGNQDPSKMKWYLLGGVAVIAVLFFATRKR